MRSCFGIAFVATAALLLVACGDLDDHTASDSQGPADQAADTETDLSEPTTNPTEPSAAAILDEDPRELLLALNEAQEEEDFQFVYNHLSERFQIIDFDPGWVRSLGFNFAMFQHFTGESVALEDLVVDQHSDFAVVRIDDFPMSAYVFRNENGEWRIDPGDHQLVIAAYRTLSEIDRGDHPWNISAETRWDFDGFGDIFPPILQSIQAVAVQGNEARITVHWDLQPIRTQATATEQLDDHLRHHTIIPLDNIRWFAGDEDGGTEVDWTNAALDDEQLRLSGWGDFDIEEFSDGQQSTLPPLRYRATFVARDLPDSFEEITLRIDGIQIGPLGEDSPLASHERLEVMTESIIPAETTAGILVGELPASSAGSDRQDEPQTPAEQDVRPATALSELLHVADVDYLVDDGSTEAHIRLDGEAGSFELPGPIEVVWEDGVVSQALPVGGSVFEYSAERDEPLSDVEVSELRFYQIVRKLGTDNEAIITDDLISTEWGDFAYALSQDGRQITYDPFDRRYIQRIEIDQDGERYSVHGAGTSFDADFRPDSANLRLDFVLSEILNDAPVQVVVEVWKAEQDLVIDVN